MLGNENVLGDVDEEAGFLKFFKCILVRHSRDDLQIGGQHYANRWLDS